MGINRSHPVQYQLRLEDEMRQWLKANAKKHHRTLLAEINMHLAHARERIEQEERNQQIAGTKKADDTVESNSSASTKSHVEGI